MADDLVKISGEPLSIKPSLQKTAEDFYSRMNNFESNVVKYVVDDVGAYMRNQNNEPFLVAGVGGILRFQPSILAKDIDVAVVGLKYTPGISGRARKHSFQDVISFTELIGNYFSGLAERLSANEGMSIDQRQPYGRGSGPFGLWDERIIAKRKKDELFLEFTSNLQSLGWYDSKGLQIRFNNSKPIDIQFVFNKTPQEWKLDQELLRGEPESRDGKLEEFFYSILLER